MTRDRVTRRHSVPTLGTLHTASRWRGNPGRFTALWTDNYFMLFLTFCNLLTPGPRGEMFYADCNMSEHFSRGADRRGRGCIDHNFSRQIAQCAVCSSAGAVHTGVLEICSAACDGETERCPWPMYCHSLHGKLQHGHGYIIVGKMCRCDGMSVGVSSPVSCVTGRVSRRSVPRSAVCCCYDHCCSAALDTVTGLILPELTEDLRASPGLSL